MQNLPETRVRSLGWEDPLEEGMATHSSVLTWRIPMATGAWWVAESETTQVAWHTHAKEQLLRGENVPDKLLGGNCRL